MISIILRTATRFLIELLLLFSVFLLLRGHNEPGGGFIGGLVAAAAYILHAIAYDVPSTRAALRLAPDTIIGVGLLMALAGGLTAGATAMALYPTESALGGGWFALELPWKRRTLPGRRARAPITLAPPSFGLLAPPPSAAPGAAPAGLFTAGSPPGLYVGLIQARWW